MGTFTAGGLEIKINDGKLSVVKEGKARKFVNNLEQRTFNGKLAAKKNANVLYVTERCVFKLTTEGLELVEVAPGIDIERDIIPNMEFRPIIKNPKLMDERIFIDQPMGLKVEEL